MTGWYKHWTLLKRESASSCLSFLFICPFSFSPIKFCINDFSGLPHLGFWCWDLLPSPSCNTKGNLHLLNWFNISLIANLLWPGYASSDHYLLYLITVADVLLSALDTCKICSLWHVYGDSIDCTNSWVTNNVWIENINEGFRQNFQNVWLLTYKTPR